MKTLEVIEYLQAIYDRRLHLKRGYSSMHAFLVQEFSYSDVAKISPAYAATKQSEMKIPNDAELVQLIEEYRKLAMLSDGTTPSVLKSALKTAIASVKGMQEKRVLRQAKEVVRLSGPAKKVVSINTKHSRYLSHATKQAVWKKNQGQCAYVDLKTQLRCGARHRLHIDHIVPFALDGQTTVSNLRLLCQAHNMMIAIQTYGDAKVMNLSKT